MTVTKLKPKTKTETVSSKTFTPVGNKVLIRVIVEEAKTPSGIVLPNQKKPTRGHVVLAGPGQHTDQGVLIPPDVRPGDEVVFPDWATDNRATVEVAGEKLLVMEAHELTGYWR